MVTRGSDDGTQSSSLTRHENGAGKRKFHLTQSSENRFSTDSVRVIAQSVPGISALRDDAVMCLVPDAEYRIREIVQDAVKFMRHSKRRRLTTSDVNAALRLRNVEPMYGFGQCHPSSTVDASLEPNSQDVFHGATGNPDEPIDLTGSSTVDDVPEKIPLLPMQKVDGLKDLYFVEDSEVNLKTLAESPMPVVPLENALTAHWLAVDGIQPSIPQNPNIDRNDAHQSSLIRVEGTEQSSSRISNPAVSPIVKPRVKHVLCKELQLYFEHVTSALHGNNIAQKEACLVSLSEEPGLMQLLPYLTLHVREMVLKSLKNLPLLFSLLRMARSLLVNPNFKIEIYLHQLLPPILTCLVGKRLCRKPRDNHWALRNYAAELIADICTRYGPTYLTVQPRITKTLVEALHDGGRPLTTHYGAIVGLGALGANVVDLLLLPELQEYSALVLAALDDAKDKQKSVRAMEAAKVYGALVWAVCISVNKTNTPTLKLDPSETENTASAEICKLLPSYADRYNRLREVFSSDLIPCSAVLKASAIATTLEHISPSSVPDK